MAAQGPNKDNNGVLAKEEATEAADASTSNNDHSMSPMNFESPSTIPTGRWRDGLFDCFDGGCCSPMFWLTFCFTSIGLARVMTRLRLNACGREANATSWSVKTIIPCVIAVVVIVDIIIIRAASFYIYVIDIDNQGNLVYRMPGGIIFAWLVFVVVNLACAIYITLLVMRTRGYTRNKYHIPASGGDCEDCCVSFWCPCCTVLQVSRHADADDPYHRSCC